MILKCELESFESVVCKLTNLRFTSGESSNVGVFQYDPKSTMQFKA